MIGSVLAMAMSLGLPAAVDAPSLTVRASVDHPTLRTADKLTLRIEAECPAAFRPDPVDPKESLPEGWEIRSTPTPQERIENGRRFSRWTFEIEPFLPGKADIKPIKVLARPMTGDAAHSSGSPASAAPAAATPAPPDAPPLTGTTEAISVEVTSVLPGGDQAAEMAGIKGVIDPKDPTPWGLITAATLTPLALIAGTWWLVARARRNAALRVVTRPAHEIALERLSALGAKRLPDTGRFKEFFEQASAILRQYIEDRVHLHAPERTTEEFLVDAKKSAHLGEADVEVLARFLTACDLIKFAKHTPEPGDADRALLTVREFVERTRAPEATVVVSGPGGPAPVMPVLATQPIGAEAMKEAA